jgi:uncharacterized protein (TIGR02677 family)
VTPRPERLEVPAPGRIKTFGYLTAEKAALYRSIMRVFMESKGRFALHLRPQEILDAVRIFGLKDTPDQTDIDSALAQLCEWGNVQTRPDTSDVSTVEDFYRQRFVFQITSQGEAAERAVELFQACSRGAGGLPTTALRDLRDLFEQLKQLSRQSELDTGKIGRTLLTIRLSFEDLASRAQLFMGSLQRTIELQMGQTDQLAWAEGLIDYIERFISELVIAADAIGRIICDIDASGSEKLVQAAAERGIADALEPTPEHLEDIAEQWRSDWRRFRGWFVSRPGCLSGADTLRGRARTSLTSLVSIIMSSNDRRISRIDRSNDFRVLARWFVQAGSEADAHRLWRAVFGLCSSRHLIVNDATLDDHEAHDVPADTSWFNAPPLRISPRFRVSGAFSRTGRLNPIVDRTTEKEKLSAATQDETQRILRAQRRFDTGQRMRLSEIEQLDTGEFDLLLDLLGQAVSVKVVAGDTAEILSNDGCLRLKLEPTGDGQTAVLHTPEGVFSGPDHWISVEPISADEVAT